MLLNLAIIIIVAVIFSTVFEKCKLPPLLGMIAAGIILGKSCIQFISNEVMELSGELRTAALIVILIRAGLGIDRETLNRIGSSAVKMSCIPGLMEGAFVITAACLLLNFTWIQAGTLAFILAAVSPAVIVPQMLELKAMGFGKNKEVPTLVLAGASVDDVFAITIFYAFISMGLGKGENLLMMLLKIPFSIFNGIVIGLILGAALVVLFTKVHMRDTKKIMLFMITAIAFHSLEEAKIIPLASLLGIMAMGFIILERKNDVAQRLALRFNKIWVIAEILLFVMIGAEVDLSVISQTGLIGLIIIIIGLIGRSLGVWAALYKSNLNNKEKTFCTLAYFPKATVQAAIGSIPLQLQLPHGEEILAIAVLSIIVTAPLGAICIRLTSEKLLEKP